MTPTTYRALVVDDELPVQKLLKLALVREGFHCDAASDGDEAAKCLEQARYDVVVTDLRMPNKHGHALAVELLDRADRPAIVIHTGVLEPRLAKDLLSRGVDDIFFKPADFKLLAAKVKALVRRRQAKGHDGGQRPLHGPGKTSDKPPHHVLPIAPVTLSEMENKLVGLPAIMPISQTALEIYSMTGAGDKDVEAIAAVLQRDATLVAEVLRLANSSFYNPSGQRVAKLEKAILRMGQKRICELALATTAVAGLTSRVLPWTDVHLVWQRSVAAGIVVELLIETGGHQDRDEGLLLAAIMHPLGRVILGTLFPRHYESMIARHAETGETLREQEKSVFPTHHAEIMMQVLATWNVPPEAFLPLKFVHDDYTSLVRVSEPTRTKAELLKVAIFLGRLAVARWEGWDLVEFPPETVLNRLRIGSAIQIVERARKELASLTKTRPVLAPRRAKGTAARRVTYCNPAAASSQSPDFLKEILASLDVHVTPCSVDDHQADNGVLFCAAGALPRWTARHRQVARRSAAIVTDAQSAAELSDCDRMLVLPNSFARLRSACLQAAGGD